MGILIACWGSLGEVRPYRWLARQFHQEGRRVVVCAPPFFRAYFEGAADRFEGLPPEDLTATPEALAALFDPREGFERLFGGLLDPSIVAQRDRVRAILAEETAVSRAFCSWIAPGALLACRESGLNPVQCHLYPQSLWQAEDMPVFTRWPRSTRAAGRGHLDPARLNPARLRAHLSQRARAIAPGLCRLQAEQGLEETQCGWLPDSPPPWPRLALFPPDFLRVPEAGVHHLANRWSSIAWPLPPAVMDFLREGPAPVLVTLGSAAAGDKGALLTAVASALEAAGARVVCHLGFMGEGVRRASERTLLTSNLPPTGLLPHARAVVHHAGMNSLQEALSHGLASLSLPRAFDQLDNAQRLEDFGLGLHLPPHRQSDADIRGGIEALLARDDLGAAARQWRDAGRQGKGLSPQDALDLAGVRYRPA